MFDARSFEVLSFDTRSWLIDEQIAVTVPIGICTNYTTAPGSTKYRTPTKRLFKSQWWKKKKHIIVDGIVVEPLKPFETFDAVSPAPTFKPAQLIRTRARKARLQRSAAPEIHPAALIRSKPTYLSLIRS
jgi:hypothetical protein